MTIKIREWVYSSEKGRDVATYTTLNFDPSEITSIEAAAKGFHWELVKHAVNQGQSENEVRILTPEQSAEAGTGNCWRVIWEAGPFEWAIYASAQMHGPWGYTEPYYSFDLCFTH